MKVGSHVSTALPVSRTQQASAPASLKSAETSSTATGSGSAQAPSPDEVRQQKLQVADLSARDRAVRAHEQAHKSVGGRYAGAPTYTFKRGPDGLSYAVGGEVRIDAGAVSGDPEATMRKLQQVQRAALAPADPSAQDLSVAAQAQAGAIEARAELALQQREQLAAQAEARRAKDEQQAQTEAPQQSSSFAPNLELYRRLSQLQEPVPVVDLVG